MINLSKDTETGVSRRTARRDQEQATKFLSTLSRVPHIRAAIEAGAGYTEADHQRGWTLLLASLGYQWPQPAAPAEDTLAQRYALVELDDWDGPAFDRSRGTLKGEFPEQLAYVFENLTAATGADAIASTKTFIDRVVALRDGTDPNREATREQDAAAAQRLADRKIFTLEIEERLRGLIDTATTLAPMPVRADNVDRAEVLTELHHWLVDWRAQARAFITRRDYQLRLGLISRSGASADDADETQDSSANPEQPSALLDTPELD